MPVVRARRRKERWCSGRRCRRTTRRRRESCRWGSQRHVGSPGPTRVGTGPMPPAAEAEAAGAEPQQVAAGNAAFVAGILHWHPPPRAAPSETRAVRRPPVCIQSREPGRGERIARAGLSVSTYFREAGPCASIRLRQPDRASAIAERSFDEISCQLGRRPRPTRAHSRIDGGGARSSHRSDRAHTRPAARAKTHDADQATHGNRDHPMRRTRSGPRPTHRLPASSGRRSSKPR